MTTLPPRTIADLDVPREQLERELTVLRAAREQTHSESDRIAYANDEELLKHPKSCATVADYPGWAEQIARRIELSELHRQVAVWNKAHPIGTAVTAYPACLPEDCPTDERLDTTTRSKAQVLGGHTAVVWVHGHGACIALSHVDINEHRTKGAS
ncbi:hypothetical protein [Streptomyces sp. N35]|uniref:hypothetical protein n=1 Tax=Streptomyces sp. N35 TaxID=2795730 RepID=UPI0018F2FCF8|nr:hypothetical protein [Streptomyces sp. N35]